MTCKLIYKKYGRKFLITALLFSPFLLHAQNDCPLKLRQAQELFSSGKIEKIPDLILHCLQSGFTREEKLQAYKLLINTYIFDNNLQSAESSMNEFLEKFPEYTPTAADPAVFRNLMMEFDNNPRFSIGIYGGLNSSNARILEYYGVHDIKTTKGKYLPAGFGFQSGLVFLKNIGQNYELGFEPGFKKVSSKYENRPFPFALIEISETQNRIDLPLTFTWTITYENLNPFLKTGLSAGVLMNAKESARRSYENTEGSFFNDIQGPVVEMQERRKKINYWLSVGGGVKYKVPGGYFFIDASYNLSLMNQVKGDSRKNSASENTWLYYYMDNDFLLNDISLKTGYIKTFYRPRKK